jgi:hypothetical protein
MREPVPSVLVLNKMLHIGTITLGRFKLNPWSRVLLEKLIVKQQVKKFPALLGS